jgi:tRNA(adenine34) deaminase
LKEALREAERAGLAGELPIGAAHVIDGEAVSRGRACQRHHQSQIRRAELGALLEGGTALWERYEEAILFATMEPCPMRLGAAVMADAPHIIFASHDEIVLSRHTVASNSCVRRHIRSYFGGVMETEARELMARFNPGPLRYVSAGRAEEERTG